MWLECVLFPRICCRTDPCGCNEAWQKKIICEATRDYAHITEIYLLAPDVKGVFPHSIVGFSHLQALSMVGTGVTGTLPSNFGDMQAGAFPHAAWCGRCARSH